MPLSAGTRFGPYEILTPIGAGGMGEVYRARDTKLNREVAIKVLPELLASDPERRARFEREATVLAALNHPNIAHIHGFEDSAGVPALVMELVEGPTLADRIARRAIRIEEALPIAKQIGEALEAAHEQGIIHRDLKPANIKVRDDGTVKVLDFGLAKALEPADASRPASGAIGLTQLPTITTPAMMTGVGMILGTAAYMSLEQLRGKPLDRHADIWAFGCLLYEMLAGQPAFRGETMSDLVAAVLEREPEWVRLPTDTPLRARRLIARCLQKDARRRVRDIGDARLEIDDVIGGGVDDPIVMPPASGRRRIATAVIASAALVVGAAIAAVAVRTMMAPVASRLRPMRFAIAPPASRPLAIDGLNRNLALSPDGSRVVYVSSGGQLMVRAIDRLDAVPLSGITGADTPFVSPDGRWIGFFTGISGELKKLAMTGGPPISLCRYHGTSGGASWGPDDTILFATNDPSTGLMSVSASGGEATILSTPDRAHGESDHVFPSILPDGRAALFTATAVRPRDGAQIALLDLKTRQRTSVIYGGGAAEYVDTGHIVYVDGDAMRTVRFDPGRRQISGDPITVVEQVMTMVGGAAQFSVSRQGALAYVPGGSQGEHGLLRGSTDKATRNRSTRRAARMCIRGFHPMAPAWRSIFAIKRTISGSGNSRVTP